MQRKWQILLLVSIGSFMAFLDAPVLSVAFPALHDTFDGAGTTTLAWTLDAYFIAFAAFLVVAGKAADRYGRKNVFIAGLGVFTLGSLACALAPSIGVLIGARALQAIGAAMVVPAGQGLMLAAFEPHERKVAIGALAALIGLGTAAAPAIGGVIVDVTSWRWIFGINIFVGIAAIAYAAKLLHAEPAAATAARPATPDWLGAALQGTALGLLVYAILLSPDWGVADARTLGLAATAIVLTALFVRRCRTHASPVIDLNLFRNRTFALANAGSLLLGIGLYAMAINSVLYFTNVWQWSILAAGLAFIPGSLAAVMMGRPAGSLAEKHGTRVVSATGAIAAAVGLLMIAASTTADANYLAHFVPGQILYGLGIVAALTGLVGAAMASAAPSQFAMASGINSAARQVGGAIGVALVAAIFGNAVGASAVDNGHAGWIVAGAALLAGGLLSLLIREPHAQAQPAAAIETDRAPIGELA
jgi:EmrB/QacA subfamily drug resistance transporter